MRRSLLVVLLALALLPAPASGQATAAPLLEDASGDVRFDVQGTPSPVPGASAYPGADLTSLAMTEARSSINVRLGVAKLPTAQDPGVDGVRYDVAFAHNGREFLLDFSFALPALADQPYAYLNFRDTADSEWSGIWYSSDVLVDTSANTMAIDVPRDVLADADGAAPYPGRSLEGISVLSGAAFNGLGFTAFGVPVGGSSYGVRDAMPDDPALAATLPILLGVQQTGDARLASDTPFRASNGEATTFIYNVSVVNLAADNGSFELSATGVPAGYTLVLPVPYVFVEAEDQATVPVLFTMPFGHAHGSLASFVLEAHSVTDPGSVGRLEMGVRYLSVPQPAGHHDTVYLHTAPQQGGIGPVFGYRPGYLNTLEDDPNDQRVNLYATGLSMDEPGQWVAHFFFPLEPALEMGLDVDSAKVGRFKVPIGTTLPILQASVEADLYVTQFVASEDFFQYEQTLLARMEPTAPADLLGGNLLFEGDLAPAPDAPRVPYQEGNTMFLAIRLHFAGPNSFNFATEGPYVMPGGSASLPLREWHDSVDAVLSSIGGPALSALNDQERLVNPGEAVVFPVSVANPLDEDVQIRFVVSGSNSEWATLPSESLTAPAHGTVTASVVVRAPPGAVDQERADLVLQAYAKDRPEARGLLRLVAEVDTDDDQVDDTATAEDLERKDTPAPGSALLAVLGLAALAARRRR